MLAFLEGSFAEAFPSFSPRRKAFTVIALVGVLVGPLGVGPVLGVVPGAVASRVLPVGLLALAVHRALAFPMELAAAQSASIADALAFGDLAAEGLALLVLAFATSAFASAFAEVVVDVLLGVLVVVGVGTDGRGRGVVVVVHLILVVIHVVRTSPVVIVGISVGVVRAVLGILGSFVVGPSREWLGHLGGCGVVGVLGLVPRHGLDQVVQFLVLREIAVDLE